MFEITLGSKLVSEADAALSPKAMIVSFILGFSGLSVQAQVAGILSETDIRFKPFFAARILQGIYAALFILLLWKPLYLALDEPYQSVFLPFRDQEAVSAAVSGWNTLVGTGPAITLTALAVYALIYCYRLSARTKKRMRRQSALLIL